MNDAFAMPESVLVLGGGSDIARATVRELISRRCRTVLLAGRNSASLDDAVAEALSSGATSATAIPFDATAIDTHPAFVEDAFARSGDIDLVLVTVGVLGNQEADEVDPASAARVINTNFTGLASALLSIAARMRSQGHGQIVVLSSVAAERARRSNFIYGASKAGLDAFTQGLADAVLADGVRVLVVRAGFVHTKMTKHMTPAPMATTPEKVALGIVRGIETQRDIIWVPPAMRLVMAVLRHLPRSIFRRLPI